MEFLDSLDYNYTNKKCSQIHSWYLYEQYKSLERNQLDAAKKLKERCSQERLLHQELAERRAKRSLYDRYELSHDWKYKQQTNDSSTLPVDTNLDNFYDPLDEAHIENPIYLSDLETMRPEEISLPSESCSDERNGHERSEGSSSAGSVVEEKGVDLVAGDLAKRLEIVKKDIEENKRLQIESIASKSSSKSIAKRCSAEHLPVSRSERLVDGAAKSTRFLFSVENAESVLKMWSKVVCFAYQVMQFNRGNCYSDSTSQLLLTILACDVVKKGFYEMFLRLADKIRN